MLCYKYFAALPLDNDTAMNIELNFKKVQSTKIFVEMSLPNRSKGAEHRNLTIGNIDIPVRCTFRDDRDTIFYKYFAALPLKNKTKNEG